MKALNGQNTGTVLWWNNRDQNGIIIDETGNEHYFDKSTWKGHITPMRKQLLKFSPTRLSCGTLVAKDVTDLLG
jgi:hypothetical protein